MSLAQFNRRHEIDVTAYNDTDPVREYGGIISKTRSASVTLRILYMHIPNRVEIRKDNGQRFIQDGFEFQVSDEEETEKSFTVIAGRTHIIRNGNTYKVVEVKDYTMYRHVMAKQCLAIRLIPIDV